MRPQQARRLSVVWLLLAGASFSVAALAAFGAILASDAVGRLIFTAAWGAIGIAWAGRYLVWLRQSRQEKRGSPETGREVGSRSR